MQITIFGASGKVGQLVVKRALANGHIVHAFVHSHNPFQSAPSLKVIQGDITDAVAVDQALKGSEAVISTLGSWGSKDKNILTVGMQTIIPAMQAQKIQRLVSLTGAGAVWEGDQQSFLGTLNRTLPLLINPKVLRDGEQHLSMLTASNLDWTCVRAPIILMKASSDAYILSRRMPALWATIPGPAVAHSLVDLIEHQAYHKQAPLIQRRP